MKLMNSLLSGAAFAFALSLAGPAAAQDCPRGDLDKRYCDVDGDLIADTPTDPADQVDPDTLIFAYTPVEDPAVYKAAWSDFLTHLEAETGKSVVFFPVQNNAVFVCFCVRFLRKNVFLLKSFIFRSNILSSIVGYLSRSKRGKTQFL